MTGRGILPVMDFRRGHPLPTPPEILGIAAKAVGRHPGYADPIGLGSFRLEISQSIGNELGTEPDPDSEILATAGASPALAATILSLTGPGDTILVPDPGWPSYTRIIETFGRKVERYPMSPFLPGDFIAGLSECRPKIIIINSPHNPTGRLLLQEDLDQLALLLEKLPGITILSDEVYSTLVFDGRAHLSPAADPRLRPATVVVRSFSKTHSMPDWRLGFMTAPESVLARVRPIHLAMGSYPPAAAQETGRIILHEGDRWSGGLRRQYEAARDILTGCLESLDFFGVTRPEGTMYLFPGIEGNSRDVVEELAADYGVLVSDGGLFGPSGSGHLRICFAREEASIYELGRRLGDFAGE